MYKKIITIAGLIGIGVLGRLLPHLPNATPVTGVIFAARKHLGRAWTFVIPLAAMVLSDLFIGFYDWRVLVSVYGAFLCIAGLSLLLRKNAGAFATVGMVVVSSLFFFLVTNFAVWAFSPWYAKDLAGLMYCYELGLPFLRNMMVGDVLYVSVLLGLLARVRVSYALVKRGTAYAK